MAEGRGRVVCRPHTKLCKSNTRTDTVRALFIAPSRRTGGKGERRKPSTCWWGFRGYPDIRKVRLPFSLRGPGDAGRVHSLLAGCEWRDGLTAQSASSHLHPMHRRAAGIQGAQPGSAACRAAGSLRASWGGSGWAGALSNTRRRDFRAERSRSPVSSPIRIWRDHRRPGWDAD